MHVTRLNPCANEPLSRNWRAAILSMFELFSSATVEVSREEEGGGILSSSWGLYALAVACLATEVCSFAGNEDQLRGCYRSLR